MSDLFLLSEVQMRRITAFFPLSHGIARVDDRRAISGIVFVITPAQPIPDDKDNPADRPPVINARNPMRKWKERCNPAHLHL